MQSFTDSPKSDLPDRSGLNWSTLISVLLTLLLGSAIGLGVGRLGVLFLLVVTGLIAVLVIILQPDWGLAAFIFITYSQLSNVLIKFHDLPSIGQPMAGLLLLAVGMRLIYHREWPARWGNTILVIGLYLLAIYVSIFVADDFSVAFSAFLGFCKDILGGVLVFFLIRRAQSFRAAIWTLIAVGLFMGSISVIQYLTGTFGNEYGGFGGWVSEFSGGVDRQRMTGPYSNPNAYSQVLIVIIPLALERLWHEKKPILAIIAGLSLFMSVLTVMFTFSRGGFLTLLVTLGIFFMQFRLRILPLLLTATIAVASLQFVPGSYSQRIGTVLQLSSAEPNLVTDESFQGRLSENLAAWRMFMDNPIFGVGVGNFPVNYQDYSREIGLDSRREARTPASLYLEILSEQGFVGLAAFAMLLFYLLRNGARAQTLLSLGGLTQESYMMKAFLAGLAGYLIAAVVKNSAYANVFWVLIGVAVGALHLAYGQLEKKATAIGGY